MMIDTIIGLRKASRELHEIVEHGKENLNHDSLCWPTLDPLAARPDADKICRLGDETIAQYEATAKAIDALTERFPDYEKMYAKADDTRL